MNIYDVLHFLIDRAVHDEAQGKDFHDAVTGQSKGFGSLEDYRGAQKQEAETAAKAASEKAAAEAAASAPAPAAAPFAQP